MDESITDKDKKQTLRKPPRSIARIACEILAGTATGFAVAVPALYLIGASIPEGCFAGFVAMGYMFLVVPPVYGLGSAVGVYLVGNMGKQTGSFLLTLGGGFAGGLIMYVMVPLALVISGVLIVGVEALVSLALSAFVILVPPITAMIGFNLSRRFK